MGEREREEEGGEGGRSHHYYLPSCGIVKLALNIVADLK